MDNTVFNNKIEELRKEFNNRLDFLKEDALQGTSKFKVGQWVIRTVTCGIDYLFNPHLKGKVFQITGIDDYDNTLKDGEFGHMAESCRPATKEEITPHLRKICDEKYVGKRVKCLLDGREYRIAEFWEINEYFDVCYYPEGDKKEVEGCWVYRNGEWAEVIPDAALPESNIELLSLFEEFESQPNSAEDFLKSKGFSL